MELIAPIPQNSKARHVPILVAGALQRLGDRVVLARKLRGLTQEQLAQLADVSLSTLRSMEDGAHGIALANFLKVLQAMQLLDQIEKILDPQYDHETLAYAHRQLGAT